MSETSFIEMLPGDPVFWKWLVFRGKLPSGLDAARNEGCAEAWLKEALGVKDLALVPDDPALEEKFGYMVREPFLRWRDRR